MKTKNAVRTTGGSRKRILAFLVAGVLLLPPGWQTTAASNVEEPWTSLNVSDHMAYISGSENYFHPDEHITRAQAAQMLYPLLPTHDVTPLTFTDVPADAWYAAAVGELGALGAIRPVKPTFEPEETITRGEFIDWVAAFSTIRTDAEPFSDVPEDHPYAAGILSARAWGWLTGFTDGTVRPDQPITRAEAVVLLNRALHRSPDKAYMQGCRPAYYLDVDPDMWYYYDIMEGSVAHTYTSEEGQEKWIDCTIVPAPYTPGFQLRDGWLCYFDAEINDFVREDARNGFDFNSLGHFTTCNAELDEKLREIVLSYTDDTMTQEQRLRALYVYVRDSFKYLRRPAYSFGATGFMEKDALSMLNTGYGNCYCYASLFWYLARWIGYDARIYSGTVGSNHAPHSWVEITFDKKSYIFDTELEMAYHKKGRYEINLYKYIDVDGWQYIRP